VALETVKVRDASCSWWYITKYDEDGATWHMNTDGLRESRITPVVLLLSCLLAGTAPVPVHAASPVPTDQVQAFRIGSYSALALLDGSIREPNDGKSFVVDQPPAEAAAVLKSAGAPTDHFDLSIQPLLVHAGSRVLLFDTGTGGNFGPSSGKLSGSLAAAGVNPASVTDIFISHAHGDHVGGLITPAGTLAFPDATIHMSAPEWQWLSGMTPQKGQNIGLKKLDVLVAAIRPKLSAFEPGANILPDVVKAVEIKGHTPGHSGYLIGSGSNTLLYIGDAMHSYVISVRKPAWKIEFDTDRETSAASRIALVQQSASTGQRLYVVHFPFPGIGKIVQREDGYVWVPEAVASVHAQ
jgi:glyoxylase-like metal-dependent hydrolase (beta-lactamase superfamily II)